MEDGIHDWVLTEREKTQLRLLLAEVSAHVRAELSWWMRMRGRELPRHRPPSLGPDPGADGLIAQIEHGARGDYRWADYMLVMVVLSASLQLPYEPRVEAEVGLDDVAVNGGFTDIEPPVWFPLTAVGALMLTPDLND